MLADDNFPSTWTPAAKREFLEHERQQRIVDEAKDWKTQELKSLSRRVARLEHERKELLAAIGEAIPGIVTRMLDKRQFASYRGIYDDQKAYDAGAMVTDRGSTWIATADAQPGERPSKAVCWRLAAKGNPDGQQFA